METKVKVLITFTWSKIMAFTILGCAMYLDIKNHTATTFMFAVPFSAGLIGFKQYLDKNRTDLMETKT